MNVNMKPFYSYFVGPVVGIALGIGAVKYLQGETKNYRDVNDIKNEIKQKDFQRYDSLLKSPPHITEYSAWEYEERLMNESIKTDSLVKRAYFEGAQMVRDSIKNARIK